MRLNTISILLRAALAIITTTLLVTNCLATINETVLHTFSPSGAEAFPYAGLIADSAGNLYGTTYYGGTYNDGTVFELTPVPGGGWTQKVLHSFNFNGSDGAFPYAGLVFDGAGNLYTTTQNGGVYYGGTVVELSPGQGGTWTENVLHSFNPSTSDGVNPLAGLVIDRAGNLYGTTYEGGTQGSGTVFELSPNGSGDWTETVLYRFTSKNAKNVDGTHPEAALILDDAGNLYGTTSSGGAHGDGAAFKLSPNSGGGWTETVLHSFNNDGSDGSNPFYSSLVFDSAGNLYGTTDQGGTYNAGTVFKLSPNGSGWTETVLYSFNRNGVDAAYPFGGVIFDAAGNLYGATWSGGTRYYGAVFELSPSEGGGWSERVLHSFVHNGFDGIQPEAVLFSDAAGNLFSTTTYGGSYNVGTMFEMSNNGNGDWTEKVYSFNFAGSDGANPEAGLISDAAGNFFGTSVAGGNYAAGSVFEMSPDGSGGWVEKLLWSFGGGLDGSAPEASLTFDAQGNLYGTTTAGGFHGLGTVFKLSPNGRGSWTETVLHTFDATTGYDSLAGLTFDATGNLYGTTAYGGVNFYGTVFELSPNGGGGWTETVLHNFGADADGALPVGNLIWDGAGNLYGVTNYGGTNNLGTAFELSPNGNGGWTETVLYSFNNNGLDGTYPYAGLTFDSAGDLYGTTFYGGTYNYGSVFELTPSVSGGWTETVLHSFNFAYPYTDGIYPQAGLVFDPAGNLYGTTSSGGTAFYGTAFELTPDGKGGWAESVLHDFSGTEDGSNPDAALIIDQSGNLYGTTAIGGTGGWVVGTVFEITR